MTTALVTGAAGFAGRYLGAALRDRQVNVIQFDLIDGQDVRDYEQTRIVIERVQPDVIFHLAGQAYVAESVTDPRRAYDVNLFGTLNVLEAVRQTGVGSRVHLAGTSEEYGYGHTEPITEDTLPQPSTPYGSSKLAATEAGLTYWRQYGIPVTVSRAFNHTGPGQSPAYAVSAFARRVARVEQGLDSELRHGDLSAWRDISDVRDVVEAYAMIGLHADPGVYNVCSGRTVQMHQMLAWLRELAHAPIPTKLDEQLHRRQPSTRFTASCDKLRAAFPAQVPTRALEETLSDLLDYWRQN